MTDAYESPLPSRGPVPPPPGERLPGMEDSVPLERRLTAAKGLLGLLAATAATLVFATLVAGIFAAFGNDDSDNHAFQFIATFGGDAALVLTAYFMTADLGRPTPATFGFRRFHPSAYGWVLVAFVAYLALAALYTVLVNPPTEDLPEQLGADESVALAVVTGAFVVIVAPFAEEFFFRGFLYQALRNSWGTTLGVARQRRHLQPASTSRRTSSCRCSSSASRSRCCSRRPARSGRASCCTRSTTRSRSPCRSER